MLLYTVHARACVRACVHTHTFNYRNYYCINCIFLPIQASETMEGYGRREVRPAKTKVGSTPSAKSSAKKTIKEIASHREHAHSLLKQRLDDVALQHRSDLNKLYLPYLQNV